MIADYLMINGVLNNVFMLFALYNIKKRICSYLSLHLLTSKLCIVLTNL